jgi:disulfide bond formation protein DsbB
MVGLVPAVVQVLSFLTTIAHIVIVLFIIALIFKLQNSKKLGKFFGFIKKKALLIAFIIALVAMLGSLFFSQIAHYTPCELCWYQRILMYPQALILCIALFKKDKSVFRYSIPMSIIGALIGGYQYIKSTIVGIAASASAGTCSLTTAGPSCFIDYFTQFGYVTIPLMAFTAFIIIIVMGLFSSGKEKKI